MTETKDSAIEENTVYPRTVIPTKDGYCSAWEYTGNDTYAKNALSSIRAFELIQKDLINLFNYIEPVKANLKCYSLEIYKLFVVVCMELEQNFKAILQANEVAGNKKNWNMSKYYAIEATHKLSHYKVILPLYKKEKFALRIPFQEWKAENKNEGQAKSLSWYKAYNELKHARIDNFEHATLKNLLDAVCGLLVILSAQFFDGSAINPKVGQIRVKDNYFDREITAIGGYFNICFPPLEAWAGKIYNINENIKPNHLKFYPNPAYKKYRS